MKERFVEENWQGFLITVLIIGVFFFIFSTRTKDSPFWPDQPTGPEIMAERWPLPEPNDPKFLHDYEKYIEHEWSKL